MDAEKKSLARTVNEQYDAGLISDSTLAIRGTEIQQQIRELREYLLQVKTLSGYSLCAAMCSVSESSQPNAWHQLSDKQMKKQK